MGSDWDARDLESRAWGRGEKAPAVTWFLPWACPGCKRYGNVQVMIEGIKIGADTATTDEQVERKIGTAHREQTEVCIYSPDRMLMGRLWRRDERGRKVVMTKKGEDPERVRRQPEPWPPWSV